MIFFVIPAYNEEGNLEPLFRKIAQAMNQAKFAYKIIVVNDGSTDKTQIIIDRMSSQLPIYPLKNEVNQGLGFTMSKGLKKAAEISSNGDIIVTMDGDGTHDPEYVQQFITKISEGAQVVVASRFVQGSGQRGVSFLRKFLSQGAGFLLKLFFPTKGLNDYTCGFRAFQANLVKDAFKTFGKDFIRERGFAATPEILIKLRHLKAKVEEVSFTLKYDLKIGKSKIRIAKTIVQYLRMIARFKIKGY